MSISLSPDLWETVRQTCEAVDGLFAPGKAAGRAAGLAGLLRGLAHGSALAGCRLEGQDGASIGIAPQGDSDGQAERLREALNEGAEGGAFDSSAAAAKLRAGGWSFEGAVLAHGGRTLGALAVAVPAGESLPRAALQVLARHLTARLALEAAERRADALRREAIEQAPLWTSAEAARLIAHELNNCLNAISLQNSVLKAKLSADFAPSLAVIRQQTLGAGDLIKRLQQYRLASSAPPGEVDLTAAARDAAGDGSRYPSPVQVEANGPVLLRGMGTELKRLVLSLLANVRANAGPGTAPPVTVTVRPVDDKAQLILERTGGTRAADAALTAVEPFPTPGSTRYGVDFLAACAIARRYRATIRADENALDGLPLVVEFPLKEEPPL